MRVMWIISRSLADGDGNSGSGTWQDGIARALLGEGTCELAVLTPGDTRSLTREDHGGVAHWLVPGFFRARRPGSLDSGFVEGCVQACREFRPDVVHVWGVETALGLLTARGLIRGPALLEIQGIQSLMVPGFAGGLTLREQIACVGLKEMKRCTFIWQQRQRFKKWGRWEREMIRGHSYIDYQSPWIGAHVKTLNSAAHLYKVDRALRPPFYEAAGWEPQGQLDVFCSSAYPAPFKGLHVAVRALAHLRRMVPTARLRIAGALLGLGLRQVGYITWIERLIRRLKLEGAIDWLGPLSAVQIVAELRRASAVVLPTFTESYCVALTEAMQVGTPTVVAYTGGTGYLGADEQTCLFFPPGDEIMCAYQLARVLTDHVLAGQLSAQARAVATMRQNAEGIARRQVEIYQAVVAAGRTAEGVVPGVLA